MKTRSILFLSFLIMIILSCGKENTTNITSSGLIGKWKSVDVDVVGLDSTYKFISEYTFNSDNTFTATNGYYPRLPSDRGTYIFDEELQMIHFKFVFENPITEQAFKNQKFVWKEMTFRDNILSARLVYDDSFPDSGSIQRDFEKIE